MTDKNPLRPDKTIHKVLISTTSRLVGEYESNAILISHAWQHSNNRNGITREEESPVSRNAFIVAFKIESEDKLVIPDYSPVGDLICSFLSVLYGKRFDNHGLTEGSGFFNIPNLSAYNSMCNHRLVFNNHQPRKCLPVPLNLEHVLTFERLFTDQAIDNNFRSTFEAASKFYLQAIQTSEVEPEIAYLHLITAGEIISGNFTYDSADLLDEVMSKNIYAIREHLDNGEKIANQIMSRVLSIKRRFVKSLSSLIDGDFFKHHELETEYGFFKPEDFQMRIGAAYDLRSKYVHTGVPFGSWVKPQRRNGDIQFGKPVVEDKEYAKILARAPTFCGLERIIRYCLLRFLESNGFDLPESIKRA